MVGKHDANFLSSLSRFWVGFFLQLGQPSKMAEMEMVETPGSLRGFPDDRCFEKIPPTSRKVVSERKSFLMIFD